MKKIIAGLQYFEYIQIVVFHRIGANDPNLTLLNNFFSFIIRQFIVCSYGGRVKVITSTARIKENIK